MTVLFLVMLPEPLMMPERAWLPAPVRLRANPPVAVGELTVRVSLVTFQACAPTRAMFTPAVEVILALPTVVMPPVPSLRGNVAVASV